MTAERNEAWIQTYTGRQFWPLDPREEEIDIRDIAHALSLMCRWGGHCREFYSVAQHSWLVSYLCDPGDALAGLLHDGSEAYLADLMRPAKHTPSFEVYRQIEDALQRCIYRRFGLSEEHRASVSLADARLLQRDQIDLVGPLVAPWGESQGRDVPPAVQVIGPLWDPPTAESMFTRRFKGLMLIRDATTPQGGPTMKKNTGMKLKPLRDMVVVRRDKADDVTPGGLGVPDAAKEAPTRGEVLAVGTGRILTDGTVHPLEVSVGDSIMYNKYAGSEVTVAGEKYVLIREDDILGILQK